MANQSNKKNNKKKVLNIALMSTMVGQALTPGLTVFASEVETTEDIRLTVSQPKDVDVVLTVGNTSVEASNFEADLKAKLQEKGVNPNIVSISAIKTNNMSAQDTFNWQVYDHLNYREPYGSVHRSKHIAVSGKDITFYGYTKPAYKDFVFMPDNTPSKKIFTFDVQETKTDWHTLEGAGFLFNTKIVNGRMDGYVVLFGQSNIFLYEITGVDANTFHNEASRVLSNASYSKRIGTFTKPKTSNHTLRIEATPEKVDMWDNGQKIINNFTLPTVRGNGFGPMASYGSHGCSSLSYITFKNLLMQTVEVKNFKDIIRQPSWRDNAERFVVNLDDQRVSDFDNASASGEILTRLMNEEISYVAMGTDTNKQQALDFIQRNDGNGAFVDNRNYADSIEKVANYVVQKLQEDVKPVTPEDPYVIAGTPLNIDVVPAELKTNTQTEAFPDGRWKLDHDEDYFNNSLGQASFSGQYQSDVPEMLDKPGRYELWFGNGHPTPQYIYAHRKPVANFSMQMFRNTDSVTVKVQDSSYDPDLEFTTDKGIAEKKWRYKETMATEWIEAELPEQLPLGKNYIVQLMVKDNQGAWSTPVSTFVTTDSAVVSKPVANFSISTNEVSALTPLDITDTSYDPAGRDISQKEWTVTKNGIPVYTGANPLTNFSSYGSGSYVLALKVKNDAGVWSEAYSRAITVTSDVTAPEASVNPASVNWQTKDINILVQFSDQGGSGFNNQRFAISNSSAIPTTGWSAWDTNIQRNVSISENGKFYVHVQAKDNAGNVMNRVLGPYEIDKIVPNAPIIIETEDGFTVNLNNNDSISGIDKTLYQLDGGDWLEAVSNNVPLPYGYYLVGAKVVNNAGTESQVSTQNIVVGKAFLDAIANLDEIDEMMPELTTQAKIDEARALAENTQELINTLKTGDDKTTLQQRLNDVKNAIQVAEDVMNAKKALSELDVMVQDLTTQELIDGANSKYANVETLIKALPEGEAKTELKQGLANDKEAIELAQDVFNATQEVEKAEALADVDALLTQEAIDTAKEQVGVAKELVDVLPEVDAKNSLDSRLDAVNETIELAQDILNAKNQVTAMEEVVKGDLTTQPAIDDANAEIAKAEELVAKVPEGELQTSLEEKIEGAKDVTDLAQKVLDAKNQTTVAEESVVDLTTQDLIDHAQSELDEATDLIGLLPVGDVKTGLDQRATDVQDTIHVGQATLDTVTAEGTLASADTAKAQGSINIVKEGEVKSDLQERVDTVNHIINATNEVSGLEDMLSALQQKLQDSDFSAKNTAQMTNLRAELAKVQAEYEKALASVSSTPVTDATAVHERANDLQAQLADVNGFLGSIRNILDDAEKNYRAGNGNADFRVKVSRNTTVNLAVTYAQQIQNALGDLLNLQWLSYNKDIATVDDNGTMKTVGNGVAKIAVYSETGVYYMYFVVSGK
ncbi:hypothetical protein CVD28_03670 [Bacillus sp. M6-12]|uniref:hypothetical protein n=1 Tax=Bacillus sp. M6-12 TaxID=2054166 RepID=UPI000C79554A|nr:hypothetical protein [Bacillus sp. M6-12]PLS19526.1 hypothetical protein CVD28_03670 [Bacillus sp. M6-12]